MLEYHDQSQSITYGSIWPISEKDASELLHRTKELFDSAGLKFSLAFGTLLGAVREKGLIKGDEDIDIFIWDEEKLRNNLISFQNNGLKLCRMFPGLYYSFRINYTCYIDVYILQKLKGFNTILWRPYCLSLEGLETPKKFFRRYEEIELYGEKYLCPENPEKILEFWYGPNWRKPTREHNFIYRVKSAYYLPKIWRYLKRKTKILLNRK